MDIIIMLLSLGLGVADEIKANPYYETKQEREANAASVVIHKRYEETERKRKKESDKSWEEFIKKWYKR